ncbi:hypothetical protein GCM10029964_077210 [Kibdelosporangium lantanae]
MSRIFLAGATGAVGRRLVPRLVAAGHQVTALTRRPRDLPVDVVVGDVYDRDALMKIVEDAAPDVVMHQLTDLSTGDRDASAEIRRTGTRNLVDAALNAGARRVVAQSIAWVYEPGDTPATERTPSTPTARRRSTPYGPWRKPSGKHRNGWFCATDCSTAQQPGTPATA